MRAIEPSTCRLSARRVMLRVVMWICAVLIASVGSVVRADDELPDRVGRVAMIGGALYLAPEDRASDWAPIDVNYPVTSGDNLWFAGDGQAEVDYGGGQFRVGRDTALRVSRLDDRELALYLQQGTLIIRARVLDADDVVRIETPTTQAQLTRPGLYRIDVTEDGMQTSFTVRDGEASVLVAGAMQEALPGQTVVLNGSDPAVANVQTGIGLDGFDVWSANRDRRIDRSRSAIYVSRQMVGAADLDDYGQWTA